MKKKKVNLYYVRTFISLIILIAFLHKKNNKKKDRLLIINRKYFSVKIINRCNNFLNKYFSSIEFINYKGRDLLNPRNYLDYHLKRSMEVKKLSIIIKKIISQYKIKKVYSGGDDIELAVFKLTNQSKPTFYIEHGHGNLISSIYFAKKFSYKKYIYNIFIKAFFYLKILYYQPIKWDGYITLLGNRLTNHFLKKNLIIDRSYVGFSPLIKKINVSKKNVNFIIDQLIKCLKIKKNLKKI